MGFGGNSTEPQVAKKLTLVVLLNYSAYYNIEVISKEEAIDKTYKYIVSGFDSIRDVCNQAVQKDSTIT